MPATAASLAELAADIDRASQAIETLLGVRWRRLGEWVVLAGHDIGAGGSQTVLASALDSLCGRLAGDERVWVASVVEVAGHLARRRAEEASADPVDATRRLQ
jgi:hypothetical protein